MVEGYAGLVILLEKTIEKTNNTGPFAIRIGMTTSCWNFVVAHGGRNCPVSIAYGIVHGKLRTGPGSACVSHPRRRAKKKTVEGNTKCPDINRLGYFRSVGGIENRGSGYGMERGR